jgi:ABC-type uncharacterized transport system permease subunit
MSNAAPYLVTFLAYGALAVLFWRAQMRGEGEALNKGWAGHLVLLPLATHAMSLSDSLRMLGEFNFGLANAASLILWLTMLVYWLARFFYPICSLQTLVLPLAAIGSALPAMFPALHPLEFTPTLALEAHIAAAMLAYSLLIIAVLHAVVISAVEKRLHHGALPQLLRNLPPLLTMESLLFRILGIGFVVLTLTLASGMLFSEQVFGKPWEFNHKTVFGLISWGVYAALLIGRHFYGWRGRIAVRWTVGGFLLLLLAYLGSQFVLQVLLHR